MLKVSVYGVGNFGFALLKHLSKKIDIEKNFVLYAHDRNKKLIDHLRRKRKHTIHHRNIKISNDVIFTNNIQEFMDNADVLILAVTSNAIREVITNLKSYINKELIILNTAKAIDATTGERFSVIISKYLKDINYPFSVAMLAGGTIAKDLFCHEPLGVDIASENKKALSILKNIFVADNLNIYTTTDIIGVEYAAAFKNVVSIFAGIIKGLDFSYGSETHMISRAANEVKKLVTTRLGGKSKTFSIGSQCWGNDMWMSCTGNTRNREFGILLGKGYKTKDALEEMNRKNKTVEGINTVMVIKKIIKNDERNFPILYNIYKIVFENKDPKKIITNLMHSNSI